MVALLGLLVAGTALASSAGAATYSNASLLSVGPDAQFDYADSPAVSADGRYVALRGSLDGHSGIWRLDMATGALDPVAVDLPGVTSSLDPQAPSISASGRYVAFDTQASLDPVNDTNSAWDVYVRDMTVAPTAAGAYTLASAVNGGTQALTYLPGIGLDGAGLAGIQQGNPAFAGTPTSPGGAISADGRTVVFSVDPQSNLVDPSGTTTPPGQVAVRNLDTHRTTLVSVDRSGGPVQFSDNLGDTMGAVSQDDAVISADASTVAWISPLGAISQEAAYLPGEDTIASSSLNDPFFDLQAVWRRIAPGADPTTYRVTGGVDPLAPGCPPGTQIVSRALPAGCAGPLDTQRAACGPTGVCGAAFSHLSLSADGYTVLLLSQAALVGNQNGSQSEAYLVDMHPGLTRVQATRALTQGVQTSNGVAPGEAGIFSAALSGDGSTVLLSTSRTRFDLTSPRYIGPPRPAAAAGNEIYAINLAQDTLDLITRGYDGSFADYPSACRNSSQAPALSADGGVAVFDSCADNLVWGDGNGASDVFSATALAPVSTQAPAQQPAGLPWLPLDPAWVLRLTTRVLPSGMLELDVVVPAPGRLSAMAWARVPGARHRLVRRLVAKAHLTAGAGGLQELRLVVSRRYRALARRRSGLPVQVRLSFHSAGGHAGLARVLALRFRIAATGPAHSPRRHR